MGPHQVSTAKNKKRPSAWQSCLLLGVFLLIGWGYRKSGIGVVNGGSTVILEAQKNNASYNCIRRCYKSQRMGTLGRIRTLNLLIRSQVLYPVELRVHFPNGMANIR